MPFKCTYQLNNGALTKDDRVVFKRYFDEPFDNYRDGKQYFSKYSTEPIKLAEVFFNGQLAFIYSNWPGAPLDKGSLVEGDIITSETEIAYFAADDPPYNYPSATIKV